MIACEGCRKVAATVQLNGHWMCLSCLRTKPMRPPSQKRIRKHVWTCTDCDLKHTVSFRLGEPWMNDQATRGSLDEGKRWVDGHLGHKVTGPNVRDEWEKVSEFERAPTEMAMPQVGGQNRK